MNMTDKNESGADSAPDAENIFAFKASSGKEEPSSWPLNAWDRSALHSKTNTSSSGPPVTECGYCELMRNKDVNQEFLRINFNERHKKISDRPIYANECLPWLRLSMEEREKVLENNRLRCKICLRTLKQSSRNSSCGEGRQLFNNGRNGMCSVKSCEKNVTMCRDHFELNKERHNI